MRRWPDKINRFPQISPLPLQRDARPIRHPCRSVPGVEPTWTGPPYGRCPQPVAWPSGSSVSQSPAQMDGRHSSFLSKSSDLGLHHQKRPFFRQHFLKRLPLPHGQRSLRPSFSSRSLSPCTMRTPRFTCVSDGNPFRRLFIVSKKTAVRQICVWTCDTSIRVLDQKQAESVLARNRTGHRSAWMPDWSLDLRRVACESTTLQGQILSVPCRGVEPRPTVSKTVMLSITPARHTCYATTGPGIEVAKFTPRPVSRVARSGIEPGTDRRLVPAASEAAVRSTTLTSHKVSRPGIEPGLGP